ncbi:MAG: RagB/SusD family nutrient uptake outer membrane protein [Gemmatimonadota bacterium]
MIHNRTLALIAALGLAAIACKDSTSVGDLNNVSAEAISGGLTRASTGLLVNGLLNASRGELDSRYLVFTETMARDFYRLDNAEARYISEIIGGPADFSAFTGGGAFSGMYVTIRSANTILNSLPTATGLTTAEASATQGLVNTFKALAYYRVLETRDSLGIAIDVNHPIDDPPAAFVCKPNALTYISALLDTASTQLAAGGASFPFTLPAGFSSNGSFTTPTAFLRFNRGLKGKVELYRGLDHSKPNTGSFATALTALNAALTGAPAGPDGGLYNTYSTSANESTNPLADANIYLNPAVGDSLQAGDTRAAKILTVTSKTLNQVTSKYKAVATDPAGALTRSIPVLKTSELLLLRAQVKIELGDLIGATADINTVRASDGGLAAIAVPASKKLAIDAVLYEKRYSLLGENAHRLVDLRAYTRLNATFLKKETTQDVFQTTLPIPKRELDARNTTSIAPTCS